MSRDLMRLHRTLSLLGNPQTQARGIGRAPEAIGVCMGSEQGDEMTVFQHCNRFSQPARHSRESEEQTRQHAISRPQHNPVGPRAKRKILAHHDNSSSGRTPRRRFAPISHNRNSLSITSLRGPKGPFLQGGATRRPTGPQPS